MIILTPFLTSDLWHFSFIWEDACSHFSVCVCVCVCVSFSFSAVADGLIAGGDLCVISVLSWFRINWVAGTGSAWRGKTVEFSPIKVLRLEIFIPVDWAWFSQQSSFFRNRDRRELIAVNGVWLVELIEAAGSVPTRGRARNGRIQPNKCFAAGNIHSSRLSVIFSTKFIF